MFELSEQAFTCVQPLLATNSRRGRPWRDHRQVLDGILWKLQAGCPRAVRALADLLWPAAPLAGRWDLAQDLGAGGRR